MVSQFIGFLEILKGGAEKILLRKNATSGKNHSLADGRLYLGDSVRVHHDRTVGNNDYIKDDMTVSFSMKEKLRNMIISGTDIRCVESVVASFMHYAKVNKRQVVLNVYGRTEGLKTYHKEEYFRVAYYGKIEEQLKALHHTSKTEGITVNLVMEPEIYEEYAQSLGGIRKSAGAEALKGILNARNDVLTIIYTKHFKNLRNSLQYVIAECPIHLAAVGDLENVRMSLSENIHIVPCEFDSPRENAIKAYYFNKHTEKYGKIILYTQNN